MTSLLQKKNTLDTKVDGLDSSNLLTQITTNTNDISTLQINKQNTLTAGDNITIVENVISSSGGGSGTTIDSTTDLSCNTVTTVGDINCGGIISTPNQISFRATRTAHAYINTNIALPFNVITYNVGGGYDNSTYTFTAPKTGTYFFYCVVFTHGNRIFTFDFLLNDTIILFRGSRPNTGVEGAKYIPSSVTTQLNSGDEVNIQRIQGTIYVASEPYTHWGRHFLG